MPSNNRWGRDLLLNPGILFVYRRPFCVSDFGLRPELISDEYHLLVCQYDAIFCFIQNNILNQTSVAYNGVTQFV